MRAAKVADGISMFSSSLWNKESSTRSKAGVLRFILAGGTLEVESLKGRSETPDAATTPTSSVLEFGIL